MCLKVLHERQVKAFDWRVDDTSRLPGQVEFRTVWSLGQGFLMVFTCFYIYHVVAWAWYLCVCVCGEPSYVPAFILKRSLKKVEVSVCLSLTAFPSPLHRNSWVDCPWQVAEMLSLLFPEFDSLMSVFSLIVFHHVECFKSVYIGYTMVTPLYFCVT